jgi:uncharacterized membrane protein (DUF373 family)
VVNWRERFALGPGRADAGWQNDAMSSSGGEDAEATGQPAVSGTRTPPSAWDASSPRSRMPGVARWVWLLEHAQDLVAIIVGIILMLLAGVLLVAAIVDFANKSSPIASRADTLLDSILLVLILVEIVHTVVLSLRTHRLVAQPFIVVGLVAVIREILLLVSPSTNPKTVTTSKLALLIAMVAVFVAALVAVSHFEKSEE